MQQFEPVKIVIDYGTRDRSSIWQQAGKLWQANAVIGLVMLLILSDFYVFLALIAENNSHLYINLPSGVYPIICYVVPVFLVGICWWRMITKGGVAAWLWGLMWSVLTLPSIIIVNSISRSEPAVGIALTVVPIYLVVSQISVARKVVAIGAGEQAAETKEQAASSEEQAQIEALNRLKPWFYTASGAVIGAFPGALLFIVMAAQPIDKNTCMGPIAFWIPAILEFLGFIIGSLAGVIIGIAVGNQWKSSHAWLGFIAVLVGGFLIGPGIFIVIYLPYSLLFPDPKTYLMPAIFFHLLCAVGVFAMPLIFKSLAYRGYN
ncbi:MAG: hypothetical protein ABFD46_04265 [Armatimonadota bacterium]